MSERCGMNMTSMGQELLCTLDKGHTGLHVHESGWITNAPQPPRQVIGEATVRLLTGSTKYLVLDASHTPAFLSDQLQPGDIVSIEVVLKERKR